MADNPVKALRVEAGLTQAAAAALVGVSEIAWRSWENGRRRMPPKRRDQFLSAWYAQQEAEAAAREAKLAPPPRQPLSEIPRARPLMADPGNRSREQEEILRSDLLQRAQRIAEERAAAALAQTGYDTSKGIDGADLVGVEEPPT